MCPRERSSNRNSFFFSSPIFVRISTTGEFEEDSQNQNIMHTEEGFEASNMGGAAEPLAFTNIKIQKLSSEKIPLNTVSLLYIDKV